MAWHVPLNLQAAGRAAGSLCFGESMDLRIARSIRRAVQRGRIRGLSLIVNNATDTRWWQRLAGGSQALCLVRGRQLLGDTGQVGLFGPVLRRGGSALGQVVLYFGKDVERFVAAWKPHGQVLLTTTSKFL